jgi:hypothetical protein
VDWKNNEEMQLLESYRDIHVFKFGGAVQLVPEVLVKEFQIKLRA